MRLRMWTFGLVVAVAMAVSMSTAAFSSGPPTTVDWTIGDFNGDNRLEAGPGDPILVRQDLGTANPNRKQTRRRLFTFAQISDLQTVDEESPERLEDVDDLGLGDDALGGAYRPQESLGLFSANATVTTVNAVRSPESNRPPRLAILTGDNADNMHENETEWYIDVLDGATSLNPNSGSATYDPGIECFPWLYPSDKYQGVRGNDWYEPNGGGDGAGYSSSEAKNFADVGRHVASRNFPGLFEEAQDPFLAPGLDIPWITAFGNHDGLAQGNLPKNGALESTATGCFKDTNGNGLPEVVQPDPKRHLLDHDQWIGEHFATPPSPGPVGHGFDGSKPNQGYYTWKAKKGLRFIALDSVNPDGLADGIIDDAQFDWLVGQLELAQINKEKVVVFAHHSLRTMNNTDLFGFEGQHCGLIDQGFTWGVPCEQIGERSLEELFYEYPNVLAYIAGHEHTNNIEARKEQGGNGRFWEITTVSEVDWPQQSGIVDIYDNQDGTISIFRTLVDHGAPLDPGNAPNLNSPDALASIGRELSYNDPQSKTGEDGTTDRRGDPIDRNVELLLDIT